MDDNLYTPIELDILDRAAEEEEDAIDSILGLDDMGDYIDSINNNEPVDISEFAYKN